MDPTAELLAVAADIRRCSATITKVARHDLEVHLIRAGVGVRALEHGVLRWLHDGPHTLADLSRVLQAPPSTLVAIIDALEHKGLVARGHDSRDRRRAPISLTAQGTALFAQIPVLDRSSVLVKSLQAMSAEQQRQLHTLLRLFTANLHETVGSDQ